MASVRLPRIAAGSSCALFALIGCMPVDSSEDIPTFPEQVLSANAPRPPASTTFAESEPNNEFVTANRVTISDSTDLNGEIGTGQEPYDRDVYEIGPGTRGDRVRGRLTIHNGSDVVLGLFDDHQRQLGYIDPSSPSAGPSEMDVVLHESTSGLYVVAGTRSASNQARAYTARITMQRGAGGLADRPQVIVLNFQGGREISIAGRAPVDVPRFDARNIDARFAGQTQTIINNIYYMVSQAYEGLGVSFYLSTDGNIPDGPQSVIYFGTYDSRLLGLADNVDPYNMNPAQEAILYTDTFSLFGALSPDVTAMSQVLANTTSHEAGHLLGLRHTADPHDLMDTTATARQMMVRQWFRTAGLNTSVLPIGFQDAPSLLSWAVGGILAEPPNGKSIAARQRSIDVASGGYDFYIPRSQLMTGCHCPDCPAVGSTPEVVPL